MVLSEPTFGPTSGTVLLSNELCMPAIGFGCAQVEGEGQEAAVHAALEAGFRLFDNASLYGNEKGIGKALLSSGIPREELFVSSTLRNKEQGYDRALRGFSATLKRLGLEYLDLYLIHWPMPARGFYSETWRAFEKLYMDGLVRAIGVSNFEAHHLQTLLRGCDIPPMVDQIEFNPYMANTRLREYCRKNDITVEAWAPLGGPVNTAENSPDESVAAGGGQWPLLQHPVVLEVAEEVGRTPAQVVLRWELQSGVVPLPRSMDPDHIRQDFAVFDFELSPGNVARLTVLDHKRRTGVHPDEMNDLV
jgi:diketogulonate reductase-like aldo/keto reductase